MSTFNLSVLKLGAHRLGGGGYLSFMHKGEFISDEVAPNTYRTIIAWYTA